MKKENYLDKIPEIPTSLNWTVKEERVIVSQVHKGLFSFIAQKAFSTPKESSIELDEFGSFVWQCIDGERNIYEIGKLVSEHFGKRAEPLYERLSKYFYTLKDVGFIKFKKIS